jgi:peroxiredoxin
MTGLRILILLLLGQIWLLSPVCGDEPKPGKAVEGFRDLLVRENRRSMRAVAEYLSAHPDADDAVTAARWLFVTAVENGLEGDVLETARKLAEKGTAEGADPALATLARQTWALGLARSGKVDQAVEQFSLQLQGARFRRPSGMLQFGHILSTRARQAGDFAAAKQIYEKLLEAFPLDPDISAIASNRIARIDLVGKPAPKLDVDDLDGKRVSWSDFKGKVVLVDFWATNCQPCLEEMPNLKRLHKELNPRGFEIIGISLDERPDLVTEFRDREKLPWRQILNSPGGVERGNDSGTEISKRFGVALIPALIIVDRQGQVVQVDLRGNDLRDALIKLLVTK